MELKDRIKEAMTHAGIKQAELAAVTRRSPGAVSQWLDGTIKSLKGDTAALIEQATGFRATWLSTGKGPKMVDSAHTEPRGLDNNASRVAPSHLRTKDSPAAGSSCSFSDALLIVAAQLSAADDLSRQQAVVLLKALAEHPERAQEITHRLEAMLVAATPAQESAMRA